MTPVFTATVILITLGLSAWALAQFTNAPLPVTVTLGSLTLHSTLPVAAILVLTLGVIVFYTGRLTGWLLRLPGTLLHIRHRKAGHQLAQAYAAQLMDDTPAATQVLASLQPDSEIHALLASLLRLHHHKQAGTLPEKLETHLANPISAPLAAWAAARYAANTSNWPEVVRLTALGRVHAPRHLPLLTLQFKALINLNDPQASTLLPAFKSYLSSTTYRLLTEILQSPTTLTARPVLDNAWVVAFQAWLPTPSEDFPDEPQA